MKITGTVVYNDFEGGFWGIEADDGEQYKPVDDLPQAVQSDGCRVEAEIESVPTLSFAMWGRSVQVHHIKPL